MSDIRYISLGGLERNNDQSFKNDDLNRWIEENVGDGPYREHTTWGARRVPFLSGIYLTEEQATIFKLKFGL